MIYHVLLTETGDCSAISTYVNFVENMRSSAGGTIVPVEATTIDEAEQFAKRRANERK
jgi:hypothetical protein